MIDLHDYFLFIGASILLCIVPGPDMLYLLGRSIVQGKRAGVIAALGINLGGYCHLFAAIGGLSAILATSSFAFSVVKMAGAAYLCYLGVQAFRGRGTGSEVDTRGVSRLSGKAVFWQGFWSDVLNPKVAVFFLALLPQFVVPENGNTLFQLLVLGFTVNIIAVAINILIVYSSSSFTAALRSNVELSSWLNRALGALLIGLGLRLANEELH